jgi:TDG/mug DNA glycosylase family protein
MTVPTRADLAAAASRTLADLIAPNLRVLFVGINPGLYSAAVGHHFGRPGNRFWPALYKGGFTPRLFSPGEQHELLPLGYGITNIVPRASARADELSADELVAGAASLRKKVLAYKPRFAAFLGITAYRTGFQVPRAKLGVQAPIGDSVVWVLPSPSGLNAHHSLDDLGRLFAELRVAAEAAP